MLPAGSVQAQTTATPPPPKPSTTIHVVQRGETLYQIALLYGASVEDITRANGIANAAQISVGQRLIIPYAEPGTNAANAPGIPTEYTVGPGDSLVDLAWRYGTTIQQIALSNHILNPESLVVGQSIALQESAEGRQPVKNGRIYAVQPTDTLFGIAARFGKSVTELEQVNGLSSPNRLYSGQPLIIPMDATGPALMDLPAPFIQASMQPVAAEQGRTIDLMLITDAPTKITGSFLGQTILSRSDDSLTHHIWVGVPALTPSGVYPLTLTATDSAGVTTQLDRSLKVGDGGYYSEKITLPPDQMVLLDPKVTQPELDKILAIVRNVTPKRYFEGPMGLPVPAAITSQYGTRRSYNGGPYDQFHTGTDFAGAPGSPIYAPAPGVVVFTGPLFVRGNATIIDHGWGVFTGYWHQKEILVNVGDVVQAGQVIGRIGSTGRVTGPHLHWELFVNGVQVDPIQWARAGFN
jgi:murein DD-endopeptidase MepM/ murein hydrolase activator NlpD